MASPTQWKWVLVNSGSWWLTGRPGLLWFMGSQRVGHDWATELNWTDWTPDCNNANQGNCSWLLVFHWPTHLFSDHKIINFVILVTALATRNQEKLINFEQNSNVITAHKISIEVCTSYVYKNKIALPVLKNIAFNLLRIRNMEETKIMIMQNPGNIQIIFQDKKEQTLKTKKM